MIPKGTAQIAISVIVPGAPPRCTYLRLPSQTATMIPTMMMRAYARSGIGPRSHTPCDGLGSDAVIIAVLLSGECVGDDLVERRLVCELLGWDLRAVEFRERGPWDTGVVEDLGAIRSPT